ncbi:hypothetical protein JIN84_17825 [Luteolibacter yonseiensis]|uniref:Pesticin C-terminal domain-containing protein n=1 Tax=Luteolibacter yonseiensis TaxID=1144680 RepID=A0A934R5S5_9BACT|nr:hypothetical protein [Luteolibacter yonseiensis]MBK1817484.1 hypothetical protein [Luteolibacter yonseiensis]
MKLILTFLAATIPAGPLSISPESKALVVDFETGGKSYYDARLQRPTWPGGASGVTVGIGYDIGYNSRAAVLSDWKALPEGSRNALASAAGIKGAAAKPRAAALKWIIVPWSAAESLFITNTMPRFGTMTASAFPGVTSSHPHVQGSLLSIVFNRGASMSGPSRTEMRTIRDHVSASRIRFIPGEIRSMKRLWQNKGLPGLIRRREAEALLIEKSL